MTLLLPAFVGVPEVNRVYNCDALTLLKAIKDNSVDCVVTSPPYDNLRTYNGYSFDFQPIARETYRVLKPGGVCVWVVGDATVNGSETLTSMRQALYFVDVCRFRMHDTMIWKKVLPGNAQKRYTHAFEYMFILSKNEPVTFNPQTRPNKRAGVTSGGGTRTKDGWVKKNFVVKEYGVYENVWDIQGGPQSSTDKYTKGHTAIFPETLARRHIETWTNPGDLVLDYFGGSGTTAKMARQQGRDYMTCVISLEYCDLMNKRLSQPYTPNMFITREPAAVA